MTDDLLVKYLVGEAAAGEIQAVEKWLAQQPANQAYYNQFRQLWQQSLALAPQMDISETAAWNRFKEKAQQRPVTKPVTRSIPWIKIAALFMVAALGGLVYIIASKEKHRNPVKVVALNNPLTDTLTDGSVVVLNKHATISSPVVFDGAERRVVLTGEAFFTVAHNTQQPFVVDCNGLSITVVGTSFNVNPADSGTAVIVETGRVLVTQGAQTLLLLPGEKVFVNRKGGQMEKTKNRDQLYRYYRNRDFICDGTPLWKLVQLLNESYDAHIVIENKSLAGLPISTRFNNEPLDKIMTVIAQTFNITIEKKDGSLLLK